MFCHQCEQTANGKACTLRGVCGKSPDVAALQDLLLYIMMGLGRVATEGRALGVTDPETDAFTLKAVFSTLTNVDFDPARFEALVREAAARRDRLRDRLGAAGGPVDGLGAAATLVPGATVDEMIRQGDAVGLASYPAATPDILSLKHTVLFGLKGVCAYADHAQILGRRDERIPAFVDRALAAIQRDDLGLDEMLKLTLECGEAALWAMELLDGANTGTYGHPVPTRVPLGHRPGQAILVSGHDLKDLEELLKQTEGTGITIYTHGEMLPAHGYPGLKRYSHLYGHFGTAWQNQVREFPSFPGAILMTTNCLQKPAPAYAANLFTCGLVGWPGIPHIAGRDFRSVIERALALPGFPDDAPGKSVLTGFARNTLLGAADQVIGAIKSGALRHIFLVGGCDGAKPGRNYFTEFVEKTPPDTVVLTLACGKFRFFDRDLGTIGGLPRLLDVGQCNDAFSAIRVAAALSEALATPLNDLPLSLVLSWYEQKAVCILLALLHLGIKGIRLGPSLPAFITPAVLDTLVKHFDIKPVTTADEDLKAILG